MTRQNLQKDFNQGEEPCSPRYSLEEKETIRRETQRMRQEMVEQRKKNGDRSLREMKKRKKG